MTACTVDRTHLRADAPLRLTRRGRLAITSLALCCGVTASLFLGGVSVAGTSADQIPTRYVTVMPGQTLWSIAGELVAPGADRRDAVAELLELNALSTSLLQAGQRLAVPLR